MSSIIFALSLTLMAGASTGIGGVMSLFAKKTNTRFLAASLGFSAGVMIYVSMVEIFMKSRDYLTACAGARTGCVIAALSFFAGMIFIGVIDFLVPSAEGDIGNLRAGEKREMRLSRMGIMTALAIGIHNFPEGLATFTSALKEPQLGVAIAAAIAIHNIPEGMSIGAIYYENGSVLNASLGILLISVVLHNIPEGMAIALPLYTSGMSKPQAALLAASTGIPAVLGAMLGYAIGDMGALGMTISLSFAAGTLLYVVFGEVLPQSINLYCSRKTAFAAIAGLVLGMLIIGMHVH